MCHEPLIYPYGVKEVFGCLPDFTGPAMSSKSHGKGSTPQQCLTLLEDKLTRCAETATDGYPVVHCQVHHKQYVTMTKRYKEAQKFVDNTYSSELIPFKDDILGYTSISTILEKARMMKKYDNAIREERTGREIHHQRFFLKGMCSKCSDIPPGANGDQWILVIKSVSISSRSRWHKGSRSEMPSRRGRWRFSCKTTK